MLLSIPKHETAVIRSGLGAVRHRVREAPNATATQDWEWLGEELAAYPCPHCREPLQRWEVMNHQAACTVCDERLHRREETDEQRTERELAGRLEGCGVPPAYRHYSAEKWQGRMPEEFAAFVNAPRGFWYIHGDAGRGKTHLAAAALDRLRMHSASLWMLFSDVPELMAAVKRSIETADKQLRPVRECQVLVLDDLGAERGSEYEESLLSEVLRYRHAQEKPTIVTSNLNPNQLREIDPKVASRITTHAVTHLGGRDRRMK